MMFAIMIGNSLNFRKEDLPMDINSQMLAVTIVIAALVFGEIVSTASKAIIPSVFVTAVVFFIGFWTIFPQDIVGKAGFTFPLAPLTMYFLIVHLGTLMSVKELVSQIKTVIIALAGLVGIIVALMTVGTMIFGKETAIVGTPPLTGGLVASILMQKAAEEIGRPDLAVLAILVFVVQGFVGYPLTSILLKKEASRLLGDIRGNKIDLSLLKKDEQVENEKKLIPPVPKQYNSAGMYLFKLALVGYLAELATKEFNSVVPGNVLSPFVTCLVFGVIFSEIGFLDKNILNKADSFGFMMVVLMIYIFDGLKAATPEMLQATMKDLILVIIIGVIGMLILAVIVGKVLNESIYMSMCIALNALYGFPPNFVITTEVIKQSTGDENERKILTDIMMPKMLIGGFVTVTIASVIIGGVFANLLVK